MTARKATLAATAFLLSGTALMAQDVTLTIESWRNDDISIWRNQIIPAFEAEHPGIALDFQPTAPAQYNSALNSKLDAGTAGDIVTCRAFDASLALFQKGQLADLTDLDGMANYSDVAKSAWSTDDGSQQFCVPMASVIHGFIYNADAFDELGLEEPETVDEFFAVLDAIAEDGSYIPMAMGVNDQWEAATMGYANIGPNYWMGEQGRNALIAGDAKLTDAEFVAPFAQLARWSDYLGRGFEAQSYPDSQNLFTLGRAAIYPAGSWEIAGFRSLGRFRDGRLPAAGADRGRHLLHFRPYRYGHGVERGLPQCRGRAHLPELAGQQRICQPVRQRGAGVLPAVECRGVAGRPAGAGIHRLARRLRKLYPAVPPDPVARHAEPVE